MVLEQLLLSTRLNGRQEVSFLQMLFPVSKGLRVFNFPIIVWNTRTIQQRKQIIWILQAVLSVARAALLSAQFEQPPFGYCGTQLCVCALLGEQCPEEQQRRSKPHQHLTR